VLADIEIGLVLVDDAKRHIAARLPDLRVHPHQFQSAFAPAVGVRGRLFFVPGNVVLKVMSCGNNHYGAPTARLDRSTCIRGEIVEVLADGDGGLLGLIWPARPHRKKSHLNLM
jgi:hypothetical protein